MFAGAAQAFDVVEFSQHTNRLLLLQKIISMKHRTSDIN
jgi:hypothetical protein